LTKAFYKKPHHKSYYLGCSQGGRQGIHAAEIYPHDFDGIVAGAPALNANYLSSWRASFFPITGLANSSTFIKPATWTGLIHDEILRQCDGLDGATDGIIEDPSLCNFRPGALLCANLTSNPTTECLSGIQVKIVQDVLPHYTARKVNSFIPACSLEPKQWQ
jgi:feruloyl esterase